MGRAEQRRKDAWRPLVERPPNCAFKMEVKYKQEVGGVSLHHPQGKCVRLQTVILVIYLCSFRV